MELNAIFNVIDTPPKVDAPIGPRAMSINTNGYGKNIWSLTSLHWKSNLSLTTQGFNIKTFILVINVVVENILTALKTINWFPSSWFLETSNITSPRGHWTEKYNSTKYPKLKLLKMGVFSIFHWPKCIGFHLGHHGWKLKLSTMKI